MQSMTMGFGTYKPFGPVHMRTLLARIHIHWTESKLTKSDINLKESNEKHHDITYLFSSLSLLSYTGTCKVCQTQHTTRMLLRSSPGRT